MQKETYQNSAALKYKIHNIFNSIQLYYVGTMGRYLHITYDVCILSCERRKRNKQKKTGRRV